MNAITRAQLDNPRSSDRNIQNRAFTVILKKHVGTWM